MLARVRGRLTAERVQVVVSWNDDAGLHRESFTVQLP
jgi:hypothetical protein